MQASGWFAGCRGVAPTCGTWRFRGSAPGRSSGLRGVAQQALGCSARFGADFDAAEHARQFFLALPCIELLHRALGDAVAGGLADPVVRVALRGDRSEEHTSELQSLMRISYAVFCLKKKKQIYHLTQTAT